MQKRSFVGKTAEKVLCSQGQVSTAIAEYVCGVGAGLKVDEETAKYYLEEAGGDLKQVFQLFGLFPLLLDSSSGFAW